jgi:MoxR-like ATPase
MTFKEYIKSIGMSDSSVSNYISVLSNIEKRLKITPLITVLDIKNLEEFYQIKSKLEMMPEYSKYEEKAHSVLSSALAMYEKYLKSLTENEYKNANIPERNTQFDYAQFPGQNDFSRRYITALLAKPFVILTGNSGTGKTRIAVRFAEWLKKDNIDNSLVVPVGADWTDNTKMLGYFNPLANDGKGEYVKTAVLDFILLAEAHKDIPFFLILDEMNLSHVERYFSDFLSAMESGKPILLYKKPEGCADETPETITLPDNLFVTGTVNIDETTYMFSPKVLDRANVIEFRPDMDSVLAVLGQADSKENTIGQANLGMAEAFLKLSKAIKTDNLTDDKIKAAKEILAEIYEKLQSSGFEFAYRTVKEISLYLKAANKLGGNADINTAIDEQVLQKILPKLHGNKKQIGKLLEDLKELFEENNMNLPLSKKKIESMIDRLDKFQYASYIQ